ncbi:MAG: hypothetical protein Q8M22_01660 [Actinomycetota bacterium]|nr:hypothetical protein [Actinomycetota bacterium]
MSDTGDTTGYDSGYTTSYEVTTEAPAYTEVPAFDPGVPVVETDSYSYNSTDYSEVAAVSETYMDEYSANADASNSLWQASVDAYLAGDDMAAYELNQASIAADSASDQAWTDAGSVWTSMEETTTVTSYETVDTSYVDTSYVDTSYVDASSTYVDTSSTYVDTGSTYVAPVVDTSYTDTSTDI